MGVGLIAIGIFIVYTLNTGKLQQIWTILSRDNATVDAQNNGSSLGAAAGAAVKGPQQ